MKNIKIIIGANFGDEGKGLMTDYFAHQLKNCIVVRFNGGAQAGHTVVTPDNTKHVFSHFGSGTLLNVPTCLSENFITNPMIFKKEYNDLYGKGVEPVVTIDPKSLVTTPYDMIINQIAEKVRGNDKHGSCGIGIFETIKRNAFIPLCFADLLKDDHNNKLFFKLLNIRDNYVMQRLKELQIEEVPSEYIDYLSDMAIVYNYIKDINFILSKTSCETFQKVQKSFDNIIFEGAQGLLLDKDNDEYFPHLTPSNTGMKNVCSLLESIDEDKDIEIVYVTRNYLTRHGAGKLKNELDNKPYKNTIDMTNFKNEYQGDLRFGLLDLDELKERIKRDMKYSPSSDCRTSIAITCLDQLDTDIVKHIYNKSYCETDTRSFVEKIGKDFAKIYTSFGNTRKHVKGDI